MNDFLGFDRRHLAESVALGPIIAVVQAVPGVVYVDVDAFGGVAERVADSKGVRRLRTLEEISAAVQAIVAPPKDGQSPPSGMHRSPGGRGVVRTVRVNAAGLENGGVRPAEIAMLSAELPETLVLNQIP